MRVSEAIILAGGFGTRLRSVVQELPKCMALVDGKPFLEHIIEHLEGQGIERIILSVGYKRDIIIKYFSQRQRNSSIDFCEEDIPLGTGGAVAKALQMCNTASVLIANGDTFYAFDLAMMVKKYQLENAAMIMCLKPMFHFERYGVVEINTETQRITAFKEKQFREHGNINAGVYLLNKNAFFLTEHATSFSLEKDFFEKYVSTLSFFASIQDSYFIDIGIPEDYERAKKDLKQQRPFIINDKTALFIDRDGVINVERPNDYVKTWDEFIFYPYSLVAINKLAARFKKIFIVTNQKGVARQIMSHDSLTSIHDHMLQEIHNHGGRIDSIFFSTALESEDYSRKPNPGMAFQALLAYPDLELQNCIIIGNSMSDMQFGYNAGMHTIFVNTTHNPVELPHQYIDMQFSNLEDAAAYLQEI